MITVLSTKNIQRKQGAEKYAVKAQTKGYVQERRHKHKLGDKGTDWAMGK